jgi:hypothetical protein
MDGLRMDQAPTDKIRCFALVVDPGDREICTRVNTTSQYSEINKQLPQFVDRLIQCEALVHPTENIS